MILHLDMDAFFASVEQMDNPSLKGLPVIIGGGARGVVATASYEARVYGVHSAMPLALARKLCPQAVFLPVRRHRYSQVSREIMSALRQFSNVAQQASIDEAYLDVSCLKDKFSGPISLGRAVKELVHNCSGGLACSVGIAPAKFLAKICSDFRKPDGLTVLKQSQVDSFLLPMKIEKLPGVGKAMASSLHSYGIDTIEQLRMLSREFLEFRYGKFGAALYDRARGIDNRIVCENEAPKSEGCEQTFEKDIIDKNILKEILKSQAEKVSARLVKNGLAGRVITIKIKFSDFRQITRAKSLKFRSNSAQAIHAVACSLLASIDLRKAARLIGVTVSGFDQRPEWLFLPGLELFSAGNHSAY